MNTAHDLLAQLRRHYLPDEKVPAGIFAPEVQAPGTARRADLIFQGCTAATGNQLIGHEIKVARSDLAAELQDLTKSHPWQRYCDRWWLVVPHPEFHQGFDLPDTWGVLAPPSGRRTRSMTILRPAPRLQPDDQAPALRALAAWQHWRLRDTIQARDQARAERDHHQQQARAAEARAPRDSRAQSELHALVERIVTELGGPETGDLVGTWQSRVTVDDIVAALRDLGTCRRGLDRDRMTVALAADRLVGALRDVDRGEVRKLAADLDGRKAAS